MANDKWLKDLFSEQSEANLPSDFEVSLMQRINVLEAEKQKKRQRLTIFLSVAGAVVSAVGIIVAFLIFGWAESIGLSMSRLACQFAMMKYNAVTIVPIAAIFFLLFADLFVRKVLSKES